jgi:putative FmdB family regulatory protein
VPTYDYVCQACGRSFEVVHGIHATRPTVCEVCGGELKKALSTPAIVFKGSGWAKKDARTTSSSAGATAAAATGDAASSDASGASGAEGAAATGASTPPSEAATGKASAPMADRPKPATGSTPATAATEGSAGSSG